MSDCCGPIEVVNIPGPTGATGPAGSNGINAYTLLSVALTIPAPNGTVTAQVGSSVWMAIGQNIFVSDGTFLGNFSVVSFPGPTSVVLKFLNYSGDSATGNAIAINGAVSAAGAEGTPSNTIANGLTGGTTRTTAASSLGLGQNALISTVSGLAQVITNSPVQIAGCSITIPALGTWLYAAYINVEFAGTTFTVAIRNITGTIKNQTQASNLASSVLKCPIVATTSYPTQKVILPFYADTAAAVNDQIQLFVGIDTVNTAGTLSVSAASLVAIPLRYS